MAMPVEATDAEGSPPQLPESPQAKPPDQRPAHALPTETYVALLAAGGILLSLVLHYAVGTPGWIWRLPLQLTVVAGGAPLILGLVHRLMAREFGSDLLAGVSIVTAVLLQEYLAGAIIVLMLSGGAALEHYATRRASAVLAALARRMPNVAHRSDSGRVTDIALDDVQVGDTLMVFPHEICPVDGVVAAGHGAMDESYLTGEPFEMPKTMGSQVLSGAINGEVALRIVASRRPVDSRYARIARVIEQSGLSRPRLRRIGDRLGAWYTPAAVAVAVAGWIWSGDPVRFLAVMVIATPCPLLIAIPVAVIGAISLSARRGIVIRNAASLEVVDTCRVLIFDKTGTLTRGKPVLTDIFPAAGFSNDEVLRVAASLEVYSRHPLAAAILRAANEAGLEPNPVSVVSEKPGEGLRGVVNGTNVQITGRAHLPPDVTVLLPQAGGGLECVVMIGGVYAAAFRFHDEPRVESHSFIRHLWPKHRITKVMMISGDREAEVRYLAGKLGIREVHYGKSPEDKLELVTSETSRARTLYVGDGINDAPAMLAATVGVAFGKDSEITAEAADAVVLEPSLAKVDELIHIGRRMRTIALESAVGGMILSALGMAAAASGHLSPVAGALVQELIDLAAVLNAVRVSIPFKDLTDF
jgi:heavy metal translocating P-type ATPase